MKFGSLCTVSPNILSYKLKKIHVVLILKIRRVTKSFSNRVGVIKNNRWSRGASYLFHAKGSAKIICFDRQ